MQRRMECQPQYGKVKWFSEEKGYGFIALDSGVDCFVHIKDVVGEVPPKKDQIVTCTTKHAIRGLKAQGVRVLSPADADESNWTEFIGCRHIPKKDFD